jgi:hypothetical protein
MTLSSPVKTREKAPTALTSRGLRTRTVHASMARCNATKVLGAGPQGLRRSGEGHHREEHSARVGRRRQGQTTVRALAGVVRVGARWSACLGDAVRHVTPYFPGLNDVHVHVATSSGTGVQLLHVNRYVGSAASDRGVMAEYFFSF